MPRRGCVSAEKVFASLPQVERGVSKIIGGDPVGNTFIYTNGKCVIIRNINFPALALWLFEERRCYSGR